MSLFYWFVRLVETLQRKGYGKIYLSLLLLLALAFAPVATARPDPASLAGLPLEQNGGTWNSGHVQGIAVDVQGGYIYYSFTNLLAKYDFSGKLVGTLVGWTGHLGDLDFNPADGKLYGSLEYKKDKAIVARGFIAANPELKWADTSRRGYMMIEVTPERVTGEWLFLQTIKARSADIAGTHRMHVERGRKVFAS